jgi:hypothetical protein
VLIERLPEIAPPSARRSDLRIAVLDRFRFTIPYLIVGDAVVAFLQTRGRIVLTRESLELGLCG